MARVGIGGFQNFDAALSRDQVVDKRLVYMTPEWKDAFRHATELADRLGLEQAIAGSPGWSESGGPWVTPAQAMKKLVWTETVVEGGRPVTAPLPAPPSATGPFQNAPRVDVIAALSGQPPVRQPEHYQDVAVIAFRVPTSDVSLMTAAAGRDLERRHVRCRAPRGWRLREPVSLPVTSDGTPAWIRFEFASPHAIRGASIAHAGLKWPFGPPPPGTDLEASDDGRTFRKVATVPRSTAEQNTVSFEPVVAHVFRLSFPAPRPIDFRRG